MVPPQHCPSLFPQEFNDMEQHPDARIPPVSGDAKCGSDGLLHHSEHYQQQEHHRPLPVLVSIQSSQPSQPSDPANDPSPPSCFDGHILSLASDGQLASVNKSNFASPTHSASPTDSQERQSTSDPSSGRKYQSQSAPCRVANDNTPINGTHTTIQSQDTEHQQQSQQQLHYSNVAFPPPSRAFKRSSQDFEAQSVSLGTRKTAGNSVNLQRKGASTSIFPQKDFSFPATPTTSASLSTYVVADEQCDGQSNGLLVLSLLAQSDDSKKVSFDTSCPTALTTQQTKDLTATPARKKAKTEAKRGASDTASLFQKIFADREPGKRKIRTKSVHEIPIDLGVDEDDSDFEDSKLNSDNEDEDMILPDDGTSEDEDKPSQGASFGDEQNLMATLWQWKDNDPEVCCVCLGRTTEADNVFVYCDTLDCGLCVHQACYGVKNVPSESESWLCDRCKAPPEEVVSCVCCPAKDGAFRRLIPEDPSGGWVHVVCALWLPEVTLGDTANVDKISVRDIPERNWNLTCYICTDLQDATLGACVQCDAGQCRKSFHVTCAQKYSLLETLEDSDMADPYFTYCKQHGSTDGHPKINGWAKWIRDRDGFLKKWQYDEGRKRTRNLMDLHQSGSSDVVGGEGLVEFFEHSYARFKHSQEQRIARERSELSRQYSIGYYLGNKIDKSRSRLEVISTKAEQALQERKRIELHTRNLLSSLLECANYLENVSAEQLEAPLSIDTTLALYNSLPDTSRWKSDIQGIIQTIDIDSLACDNPYAQIETQAQQDSGIDDSEGSRHRGRPFKGILGTLSKKAKGTSKAYLKNVKAKKVPPNLGASTPQVPVVLTSSRGRLIKRDNDDCNDYYSLTRSNSHTGAYLGDYSPVMSTFKTPKPIAPCTLCHQLTLPEKKLNLERDEDGNISPMAIKVLNRMVCCATCQRQFHPKCLDPPMARVPPRGYSWNCEDCDSSGESPGSGGESSPTVITHPRQNRHSSDLDEALMVLADTAMTVSAYQPHPPNKQPRGAKRTVTAITTDESTDAHTRATVMGMPASKHSKAKKAKTEADSPTWPKSIKSKDKIGCDDKDLPAKKFKANANTTVAEVSSQAKTMIPIQTSPVAPIIRGNLRIYPPGPHIAPKVDFSELQAPKVSVIKRTKSCGQSAKDFKAKAENTSVKMSKSRAGVTKIRNGNLESAIKVAKSVPKKAKIEAFPSSAGGNKTKKTSATAKTGMKKKTNKATPELEPHGKRNIKAAKIAKTTTKPSAALAATKEKPMTIQQGSLPDAPASAPKRKEIIRYTVGEKTVEELTARDDVEVERRENVKFRRLRGRTLTMPAPPQEWNEDGPGLTGISAATLATAPLPGL